MEKKEKLKIALQKVEELYDLLGENEWTGFFSSHLIPMKFELERQISTLTK